VSERFCVRTYHRTGIPWYVRTQILLLAGAGLLLGLGAAPTYAADDDVVARITDERIAESSALVQSTLDRDLAYTINDSGNATVVYVLELATGEVVGTATLDVDAEDTEAMAIGGDDRLYVADIGDNDAERESVALYAIDQPARGDTTVTPDAYEVRYEDGPADAETLLVDPGTGGMSIVTKDLLAGEVLRLPTSLRTDRTNVARPLPDVAVPGMVTDGAFLPDGSGVLLRTYIDVIVYDQPGWRELEPIETPPQPQSESLAAWDERRSVLVGTEKLPSTIIEVPIPRHEWARLHAGSDRGAGREPNRDPSPGSGDDAGSEAASEDDDGIGRRWVVASGAAVMLLGAGWLLARRRRPGR
jgi:hypothetical protein